MVIKEGDKMQRLQIRSFNDLSKDNIENVCIIVETSWGEIKVGRIVTSTLHPIYVTPIEFDGKLHFYKKKMPLEQFSEKLWILVPDNYFDVLKEMEREREEANSYFKDSFPSEDDYNHYIESIME